MMETEEILQYLTDRMKRSMAERESHIEKSKQYWDGRPRSMLNDRLREIDTRKIYAQFTLETTDIQVQREQIIDALTQIEMCRPLSDGPWDAEHLSDSERADIRAFHPYPNAIGTPKKQ